MKKTILCLAKDTIITFVFEFIWILFIIELSAKLASDFFVFIPAGIFAIGMLTLLGYLNPKFYIVIVACVAYRFIFPYFDSIFNDGFHAWEMQGDGWVGMLMHNIFWGVSLGLQLIALTINWIIRGDRKEN